MYWSWVRRDLFFDRACWELEAKRASSSDWLSRRARHTLRQSAERWDFQPVRVLSGGATDIAILGRTPERAAVLKASRHLAHLPGEVELLKQWSDVCPDVLACDVELGALLLGFVETSPRREQQPISQVLTRMWATSAPADVATRTVSENCAHRMSNYCNSAWADDRQAAMTCEVFDALTKTTPSSVVCHGDFQPRNAVAGGPLGWTIIDPMPSRGDRLFDLALWLVNEPGEEPIRERCLFYAADLDLDERRLWAWAVALSVPESYPTMPERERILEGAQRALPEVHAELAGTFIQ